MGVAPLPVCEKMGDKRVIDVDGRRGGERDGEEKE